MISLRKVDFPDAALARNDREQAYRQKRAPQIFELARLDLTKRDRRVLIRFVVHDLDSTCCGVRLLLLFDKWRGEPRVRGTPSVYGGEPSPKLLPFIGSKTLERARGAEDAIARIDKAVLYALLVHRSGSSHCRLDDFALWREGRQLGRWLNPNRYAASLDNALISAIALACPAVVNR